MSFNMFRSESTILNWYARHARLLPWRETCNPYRILVSEVMLQQTQVERVIEKYKSFLLAFPDIGALAGARSRDVIIAWQGLGYNRRALFLQRTARAIRDKHRGKFPKDIDELKTLPGVGDYTARAILSFAFDEPVPMMDTNHREFYTRAYFDAKPMPDRTLLEKAEEVVGRVAMFRMPHLSFFQKKKSAVYHWNQALMDFISAVRTYEARGIGDPVLARFAKRFPMRHTQKEKKKRAEKFRDSDRWYRGKIIDLLREYHRFSIALARKQFPDISDERYHLILRALKKDGLIRIENKSMMLV